MPFTKEGKYVSHSCVFDSSLKIREMQRKRCYDIYTLYPFFLKKTISRYYECNIKGEQKELLCPDGLVYDEKQQNCDYPSKVVCGNRTKLRRCNDLLHDNIERQL